MLPLTFFAGMLTVTLLALLSHFAMRRRVAAQLQGLAAHWKMHYAEHDQFQLTERVVERFSLPGASDVTLIDVIYKQEADRYRYLFTVVFTEGVVRTKNRASRVGTLCEPRDGLTEDVDFRLILAPAELPWLQQYSHLLEMEADLGVCAVESGLSLSSKGR